MTSVKLMYLHRRQGHLSLDEYHEHWLEHHVPRFGHVAMQARRYALYPLVETESPAAGSDAVYDGVSVVWFDNIERARALIDSPTVIDALSDEQRFIDHDRSIAVLATEETSIEPDGWGPIVLFRCVGYRPDAAHEAVESERSGMRSRAAAAYRAGLCQGHVMNRRLQEARGPERYNDLGENRESWDEIETFYFDSLVLARPFFHRLRDEDHAESGALAQTLSFLTRRRTLKDLVR